MKRFIITLSTIILASLCITACNKDENKQLTATDLYQTVWECSVTTEEEGVVSPMDFIIEFITKDTGKLNLDLSSHEFTYNINDDIITFQVKNVRLISGDWHITKKSKNHVELLNYAPAKRTMTMDKTL